MATRVRRLRFWLLLPLVVFLASTAVAQGDWSAIFTLDPFPSPYLSDWQTNPAIGQATITNGTGETIQVRIRLTITHTGKGQIAQASSRLFTFPPGSSTDLRTRDLVDYSSVDYNKSYEEVAVRTGRLPEGEYEACLRLESESGAVLLEGACASFTIVYPDPPYLIYPTEGESITSKFPIFQWTPVQVPVGYGVHYTIRIAELLDGQAPAQSLGANYPHFERSNLATPGLQYPFDGPAFQKGKPYAWQVQALDDRGYPPSTNNGRSEIWTFIYDADTTTPIDYKRLAGRVVDSLTGNPLAEATVVYRPVTMRAEGGDTTWSQGEDSIVALSDVSGDFRIDSAINRSFYCLEVRKTDYLPKRDIGSQHYQNGDISNYTLRMTYAPPGERRLAGVVRDFFTEEPVPNVTVTYHVVQRVTSQDSTGANTTAFVEQGRKQLQTVTDEEGRFEFTKAADSSHFSLRAANPPAYLEAIEVGEAQYQRGDIDNYVLLIKPNACNFSGNVTRWFSGEIKPVVGTLVQLERLCTVEHRTVLWVFGRVITESTRRETVSCGPNLSAYSGRDGRFVFPRLSPQNPADFGRSSTSGSHMVKTTTVSTLVGQTYRIKIDNPQFQPYLSVDSFAFAPGETVETGEHRLSARTGSIVGLIACDTTPVTGADVYLYPASRRPRPRDDSEQGGNGAKGGTTEARKGTEQLENSATATSTDTAWSIAESGRPSTEPLVRVQTDEQGRYFFSAVPINDPLQETDRYAVWVESQGYNTAVGGGRLEREGQTDTVDVRLQRTGGVIFGTVTRNDESAISGARVELYAAALRGDSTSGYSLSADSQVAWVETPGDGSFSFANLPQSLYRLKAVRTGYIAQVTDTFSITYGDRYRRDVTLDQAGGVIAITVTDKVKEKGLRDVSVKSPQIPSLVGFTADSGKLAVDAVADSVLLQFRMIGYADLDTTVLVKANDTVKLSVALAKRSGEYRVLVVEKGAAPAKRLPNIDVVIGGQDTVVTDLNGEAYFKAAPAGKQKLKATAPNSPTYTADYLAYETEVEIREGFNPDTLLVELSPAARMSGEVVSADSGTAISGVVVRLDGSSTVKATTDDAGKFTLRNVPADETLKLSLRKTGYRNAFYTHDKKLAVGEHARGIVIKIERSPMDSLMGFAIVVDSIVSTSGGKSRVWGGLVDIPPCFGLKLKDADAMLSFAAVEVDSAYRPLKDTIVLTAKEVAVSLFGCEAQMKLAGGLMLEWVDTSKVGRITGDMAIKNVFEKVFPDTKLPDFTIPKKYAPSFWAGGVNRGLERFGLTATGTEIQAKFRGVGIGLDYAKTYVDTGGLHLAGSLLFKEYKVGFENLNLSRDSTTDEIVFKAVTVVTTPPISLNFGAFTFVDSAMTWEATGFRASGAIIVPPLKNWTVGFKDLRISPDGEFLSLALTLDDKNGTIEVHGQKFHIRSLEYGTENFAVDTLPHYKFLSFAGSMEISKLDKPVELKVRYSQKDQFTGKLTFNQSKTFAKCVTLQIESIELGYEEQRADRFVGFSGGVKFGAVKGLSLQASNLRFWMSGSVTVDEIAANFMAGPVEVQIKIHWTDSLFEGKGLLRVRPVFSMGAEFRYAGSEDWWIKVIAGLRVPMGPCELVEVRGGLGRKGDSWRFAIGGRISPAKADKGISLDVDVEVHSTPKGVIILGNASVEVAGSTQVGRATIELNFPEERIVGSIICEYNKEALVIGAQVDLGVQFGKYWYIHGRANIKFLEFFHADGVIVIANNWQWQHNDSLRTVSGIYVELNSDFRVDANWRVIRYGIYFDRHAMLYIGWNGDFAGAVRMKGGAYAWIGLDLGIFEISLIQARADMALAAAISRTGAEWAAMAHGNFSLQATLGYCPSGRCWSLCWKCIVRIFGKCIIAFPTGAKACVSLAADVRYSTSGGTQVSVSF